MNKLRVLVLNEDVLLRREFGLAVEATGLSESAHFSSSKELALEWLVDHCVDVAILPVWLDLLWYNAIVDRIKEKNTSAKMFIYCDGNNKNSNMLNKFKLNGANEVIWEEFIQNKSLSNHLKGLFTQTICENTGEFSKMPSPVALKIETKRGAAFAEEVLLLNNEIGPRDYLKSKGNKKTGKIDLILIASSTGGPKALEEFFVSLRKDFNVPILVVQHIPPDFSKSLAESISRKGKICVLEAQDGMQIENNKVYLAPGGMHMKVGHKKGNYITVIEGGDYVNGVKPAADVLFASVAQYYKGLNILTVIFTGMGKDGTKGLVSLNEFCNCHTICQSERTCIVFGMPGSAIKMELADEILDLKDIAPRVSKIMETKQTST